MTPWPMSRVIKPEPTVAEPVKPKGRKTRTVRAIRKNRRAQHVAV
jgi:hypothetical protein